MNYWHGTCKNCLQPYICAQAAWTKSLELPIVPTIGYCHKIKLVQEEETTLLQMSTRPRLWLPVPSKWRSTWVGSPSCNCIPPSRILNLSNFPALHVQNRLTWLKYLLWTDYHCPDFLAETSWHDCSLSCCCSEVLFIPTVERGIWRKTTFNKCHLLTVNEFEFKITRSTSQGRKTGAALERHNEGSQVTVIMILLSISRNKVSKMIYKSLLQQFYSIWQLLPWNLRVKYGLRACCKLIQWFACSLNSNNTCKERGRRKIKISMQICICIWT